MKVGQLVVVVLLPVVLLLGCGGDDVEPEPKQVVKVSRVLPLTETEYGDRCSLPDFEGKTSEEAIDAMRRHVEEMESLRPPLELRGFHRALTALHREMLGVLESGGEVVGDGALQASFAYAVEVEAIDTYTRGYLVRRGCIAV